ncbi:hypothetical protein AB0L06_13455 [Spirillospora sp. NPDC052269]
MDRRIYFRVMIAVSALFGVTVGIVAMVSDGLVGPTAAIGGIVVAAGWAIGAMVTRPAGGGRDRGRDRTRGR